MSGLPATWRVSVSLLTRRGHSGCHYGHVGVIPCVGVATGASVSLLTRRSHSGCRCHYWRVGVTTGASVSLLTRRQNLIAYPVYTCHLGIAYDVIKGLGNLHEGMCSDYAHTLTSPVTS